MSFVVPMAQYQTLVSVRIAKGGNCTVTVVAPKLSAATRYVEFRPSQGQPVYRPDPNFDFQAVDLKHTLWNAEIPHPEIGDISLKKYGIDDLGDD